MHDTTHLYYVNASTSVQRIPKAGGTPETLASNQPGPDRLAVDDTHVYWRNAYGGAVMRVSKLGGMPEVVVAATPSRIALHGNYLYYDAAGWTVMRVPKSGGVATEVWTGTFVADLEADDDGLYIAPNDGLPVGKLLFLPMHVAPPTTLPCGGWCGGVETIGGPEIYVWGQAWSIQTSWIAEVSKASATLTTIVHSRSGESVGGPKTDGESLFFYSDMAADGTLSSPHIRKASPCLGLQTGVDLIANTVGRIAVGDANVYFVDQGGEVASVPK
ncbi:MAG: hypothetical protein RIF41_38895 [Polyangiaceae bacterium]